MEPCDFDIRIFRVESLQRTNEFPVIDVESIVGQFDFQSVEGGEEMGGFAKVPNELESR
jgi:hypothetical protein